MKKHGFKSILSLLLAVATMLSFSVTAFAAESSVTFEDGKIVAFEPGSVGYRLIRQLQGRYAR